ncbi:dephospho-CoA kinase [Rickettsia prowazekii str. GvV257]|uniref:Dephospho-CoA kinase n=2 Tax=Rickettsia prowazekii TaxID=782 RepID=COAE_RICPR|nr:dephospho-CoA kinase [Rickettsia prowazekii]Q9ZCK0.1 RecName: Full=Dephospho-CoA kinase; AltName: Full=Dephosphocoenzyme A kinase [Rickettsia prowazekii str. Madrid E]EOB10347.1 Dephospho-CoA kinase [Rickettsia prowazekii str. GvF12]ADE30288.1 Dephospho-CoA kinase [Rickettsia prowazekii str. Rp22]AFE49528.1 dephospho-CoA kinase [Rickettsia prowazekii str. Chernikova]AFE50372.1 dephospho-CoA kinase [Rickettsia prowazekii str. Katsinyian]AFE51217.1 dephospho-CoA kinase [Rickettsia prowazekii
MLAIGITGSYASGKTFILNYLSAKGYKTFCADRCIKELYKDIVLQTQILKILPELEYFNIRKISNLIYNNDIAREKLQNFIYPLLIDKLILFKKENTNYKLAFSEIPLLYEAKFEQYFDFVVTIYCSEEIRMQRAITRAEFDINIYNKIKEIQLSQESKIAKADFSINSGVDMLDLEKQITKLIKDLECRV